MLIYRGLVVSTSPPVPSLIPLALALCINNTRMPAMLPSLSAATTITALHITALDSNGRLPIPERILIAPWGTSTALDGSSVIVDDLSAASLSSNQAKLGRSEIALDFEHNTVPGQATSQADPKKVAAYGTLSAVIGKGIYFTPTHWTPEGKDHYTGGHYRDISPTVIRDATGRVVALHSVALTRAGQIEGLHAYSVKLSDALKSLSTTSQKIDTMKELLCKLLNLPDTATDEEITAAATTALSAKTKEDKTDTPVILPMSAEARLDKLERNSIISAATAAGKIIPFSNTTLETMPLSVLTDCLANLKPSQVPLKANTSELNASAPKALSVEESHIANLLGIDHSKYAAQLATTSL